MANENLHAELIALADYVMTSEDKKMSVIGVFDKLFITDLPATHAQLSFVVTLAGGEQGTSENMRIRVLNPSGQDLTTLELKISFGENGKANVISNFTAVPFNETGTYAFVLENDQAEYARYTLEVILLKQPSGKRVTN